jgi:hypothetical protein
MHSILTTATFERKAAQAGLAEDDVIDMSVWISDNPHAGTPMTGTGGARKVRFAGKGKGKSGGFRTVHFFAGDDVPIFLLTLINKGERDNLTKAERNELAKVLSQIADAYRAGVKANVLKLRRRT